MELQDWVNIMTAAPKIAKSALDKMCAYCIKDVEDTRTIYNSLKAYIKPKFNMSLFRNDIQACTNCGSTNIIKNGTRQRGKVRYQRYECRDHGGFAGYKPILVNGKESNAKLGV